MGVAAATGSAGFSPSHHPVTPRVGGGVHVEGKSRRSVVRCRRIRVRTINYRRLPSIVTGTRRFPAS